MSGLLKVYRLNNFVRTFSMTSTKWQSPSLVKLKKLQADFQCADGRPVFLKGGFCDRILFTTTLCLCALGLTMNVLVIYDNAKPESWKKKHTC